MYLFILNHCSSRCYNSSLFHESVFTMSAKIIKFLFNILEEIGLLSLWSSPFDTKLLCLQRFVRLFAYGSSTLILVSYISAPQISKPKIGLFMTLTLIGDASLSFFF